MPRASSRNSAEASASSSPRRSRNGAGRVPGRARSAPARRRTSSASAPGAAARRRADRARSCAARRRRPRRCARARRAAPRASLVDLAPAQRVLGLATLGDVERSRRPSTAARRGRGRAGRGRAPSAPRRRRARSGTRARTARRSSACRRPPRAPLAVVGVDDAHERALRAGDEVLRRVARDALDLVADQLERVVGVPGRAVDRAGHVDHQRPQQRVVGALLRRAQAGARAGEQLARA